MTGILPTIKTDAVPVEAAKPIKGLGVLGRPELREISNGYVQIALPIFFFGDSAAESTTETLSQVAESIMAAYDNSTVDSTVESLGMRTFIARWNVRPEWFDPTYAEAVKNGKVSDSEKIQYRINMGGLTRGLFAALGLEEINFEELGGQVVGFNTRARKNEPQRLDIASFYKPKT